LKGVFWAAKPPRIPLIISIPLPRKAGKGVGGWGDTL